MQLISIYTNDKKREVMKIFIVIPCYNEEAVLPKTLEVLGNLIKTIKVKTDADTELLLVDDGSRDRTWQMISDAAKEHKYVHGIKLSHNRGHQNALWAGMEAAVDHCDAMVSIDADLQDDENVIIDMVQQVQEGKDIIYGVRKERKTDTFFKRFTAQAFYKLMQSVDKDTVYNHADFRMMTNRTLKKTKAPLLFILLRAKEIKCASEDLRGFPHCKYSFPSLDKIFNTKGGLETTTSASSIFSFNASPNLTSPSSLAISSIN